MQTLSRSILFITSLIIFTKEKSNAFHVVFPVTPAPFSHITTHRCDVSLRMNHHPYSPPPDDFGDDIDAVREKLESMLVGDGLFMEHPEPSLAMSPSGASSLPEPLDDDDDDDVISPHHLHPTTDDVYIPRASPLTTIERERRETEVEILKHLALGDDMLSELMSFWMNERGSKAAARLLQAEAFTNQKETWNQAEMILLELVDMYGVHWVEPVNRLATLYYLQGRLHESERLCRTVLKIKPWHVGALSGIVLVYAAMDNASDRARQWAARRLPPLSPSGPNRRRHQWVERNVKEAEEALLQAEKRLKGIFGAKDTYPSLHSNSNTLNNDDDDMAWQ